MLCSFTNGLARVNTCFQILHQKIFFTVIDIQQANDSYIECNDVMIINISGVYILRIPPGDWGEGVFKDFEIPFPKIVFFFLFISDSKIRVYIKIVLHNVSIYDCNFQMRRHRLRNMLKRKITTKNLKRRKDGMQSSR